MKVGLERVCGKTGERNQCCYYEYFYLVKLKVKGKNCSGGKSDFGLGFFVSEKQK